MHTLKRQTFAREYAVSGNGLQSAISAGYSKNSAHVEASRLLKNAEVVAVIEKERARLRVKSDLKAEDVIRGLRQIAEDESAPHSARVQSWKILGQHLGLFNERLEVSHSVDIEPLTEFSIAQLHTMLSQAQQQQAIEAAATILD